MISTPLSMISKSPIIHKKVAIAGDGGTGKSTLVHTKNSREFTMCSKITIGVDFDTIQMKNPQKECSFLIYDLGGQPRFQFMHDSYIKGTKGAIILYDLTRPASFDHLPQWLQLFQSTTPNIPIIIGGTKKDLASKDDLTEFATKWIQFKQDWENKANILGHIFLSSKLYEGIDEIFDLLLEGILKSEILLEINST